MTTWRTVSAVWSSPSTRWAVRRADALFGSRIAKSEDREDLVLRYDGGVKVRIAFYDQVVEASGPRGDFWHVESGDWTKTELGTVLQAAAEAVR